MKRLVCLMLCVVCVVGLVSLAYAALTASVCKANVDSLTAEINGFQAAYDAMPGTLANLNTRLEKVPTFYAATFADVTAAEAATPTNRAWGGLKDMLDLLKTQYLALKPKVDCAANCFAAIEKKGPAAVQAALDGIK